jgi:hypothetical protein
MLSGVAASRNGGRSQLRYFCGKAVRRTVKDFIAILISGRQRYSVSYVNFAEMRNNAD